jgi:hypothetical protein
VTGLLATEMTADLFQRLHAALSVEGAEVRRLGAAGTSVTLWVTDAQESSVTLLLDRQPPAVVDGREPAESVIELTSEQADRFARGLLPLPGMLVAGRMAHSGPIRKYLSVDPVLRSLLLRASANGAGDHDGGGRAY